MAAASAGSTVMDARMADLVAGEKRVPAQDGAKGLAKARKDGGAERAAAAARCAEVTADANACLDGMRDIVRATRRQPGVGAVARAG